MTDHTDERDRLIDSLLEEAVGGRRVPDLAPRILALAGVTDREPGVGASGAARLFSRAKTSPNLERLKNMKRTATWASAAARKVLEVSMKEPGLLRTEQKKIGIITILDAKACEMLVTLPTAKKAILGKLKPDQLAGFQDFFLVEIRKEFADGSGAVFGLPCADSMPCPCSCWDSAIFRPSPCAFSPATSDHTSAMSCVS